MNKFDFDYLLKRSEVINEMAKPVIWLKLASSDPENASSWNELSQLHSQILSMAAGKFQLESRPLINYIVKNLYYSIYNEPISKIATTATEYFKAHRAEAEEWAKSTGKTGGKYKIEHQAQYKNEFFITSLVSNNPDVVKSKKFKNNLLNFENLQEFVRSLEGFYVPTNPQSEIRANRLGKNFKVSPEEFFKILEMVKPLIKQINILSKQQMDDEFANSEEMKNTEEDDFLPPIRFAQYILSALTTIKYAGKVNINVRKIKESIDYDESDAPRKWVSKSKMASSGKTQNTEIKNDIYYQKLVGDANIVATMDLINKRIADGVGITPEQFGDMISNINNEKFKQFLQYVLDKSLEIQKEEESDDAINNDSYPGYDPSHLKQVLGDDKQKWDLFDKYYKIKIYKNEQYHTNKHTKEALEVQKNADKVFGRSSNYGIAEQIKDIKDQISLSETPGEVKKLKFQLKKLLDRQEKFNNKEVIEPENVEVNTMKSKIDPKQAEKIQAKIKDILLSDDPDYDELEKLKAELNGKSTVTEKHSVMNYMTEQIYKDSFVNKSVFKDRGFKKPVNYAHWLAINEPFN